MRIEDYALIGDLQSAALMAATVPTTGCACRGSTRPRASRRSSGTRHTGSGSLHRLRKCALALAAIGRSSLSSWQRNTT
jgi:hypothetical protein